ncbi:MAG: hypothetical protein M4579_007124 [Chaenotheca gracillima]|nr:MAG: hypothetical protein M4579_007124 [Chaenotheca gracillima]
MTSRIAFKVQGEVQGVNFRSFTQKKAQSFGLTGWVKNTSSGHVEGEAQGSQDAIQKLLKELNQGPSMAHVTKVEKSETEVKQSESSFNVT